MASQLSPAVVVPVPEPGDRDCEHLGKLRRMGGISGAKGQQADAGALWE